VENKMSLKFTRALAPLVLLTALSLIVGCATKQELPEPADKADTSMPDTLDNSRWQVEMIYENEAGATVSTLQFGPDNRVSGNAGCNNFTGQFKSSGTAIDFGLLATTRKMCEPAVNGQERAYLEALDVVAVWRRAGSQLELVDAENSVLISLRESQAK
jgi:heat shock protein HslJ